MATKNNAKDRNRVSADDISTFMGTNVRHRREELGFTQGTLADALGIHRVTLNAIEQGRQWVRGNTLADLCYHLNCKPAELMTPDFF